MLWQRWTHLDGRQDTWQDVLPIHLRREFLVTVHSVITSGHLGIFKTEDQVQRRTHWPGWREQTEKVVQGCEQCAGDHGGQPPRQMPLVP